MMDKSEKPPTFTIMQILDKTTIVIGGEGVGKLTDGVQLSVVAVGPRIPSTGVPLVLEKAKLEVTLVTSAYAVARPPLQMREEPVGLISWLPSGATREVSYRPGLPVEPEEERGNPASDRIRTGDTVIRKTDFRAFADSYFVSETP